jgi:hypothetical protein
MKKFYNKMRLAFTKFVLDPFYNAAWPTRSAIFCDK